MIADFLQSALAIDLLLQSPQRFVDRFAFFESNFGQIKFTSSPGLRPDQRFGKPLLPFGQVRRLILLTHTVNGQTFPRGGLNGFNSCFCENSLKNVPIPLFMNLVGEGAASAEFEEVDPASSRLTTTVVPFGITAVVSCPSKI